MHIVGRGFLARHLAPIRDKHEGAVLLAAGVSWASGTSADAFARESALVHDTIRRCLAEGTRLVVFSTASAGMYGAEGCPGREDEPVVPQSPYGWHKLAVEDAVRASGVDHLILRVSHVIGSGQPAHQLLPTLVRQIDTGEVTVHCGATRDLIDVEDAMAVVDRLLTLGVSRDVVNIASGTPVPIERMVERIEQVMGRRAQRRYVADPGSISSGQVSTAKLRALIPPDGGLGPDLDGYYRRLMDKYVPQEAAVPAVTG